jgi:hypothetical protein
MSFSLSFLKYLQPCKDSRQSHSQANQLGGDGHGISCRIISSCSGLSAASVVVVVCALARSVLAVSEDVAARSWWNVFLGISAAIQSGKSFTVVVLAMGTALPLGVLRNAVVDALVGMWESVIEKSWVLALLLYAGHIGSVIILAKRGNFLAYGILSVALASLEWVGTSGIGATELSQVGHTDSGLVADQVSSAVDVGVAIVSLLSRVPVLAGSVLTNARLVGKSTLVGDVARSARSGSSNTSCRGGVYGHGRANETQSTVSRVLGVGTGVSLLKADAAAVLASVGLALHGQSASVVGAETDEEALALVADVGRALAVVGSARATGLHADPSRRRRAFARLTVLA